MNLSRNSKLSSFCAFWHLSRVLFQPCCLTLSSKGPEKSAQKSSVLDNFFRKKKNEGKKDMSGVEGSTACPPPNPQLPLCASSRFAKSCPQKRSGSYPAPPRYALSCGMILPCDLSRRAATSTPSPFPSGGAPFRVMPQSLSNFRKLVGSARRREKRAPRRDEVPREDERASGRWLLWQRAIAPQVRRQCFTRRRTEEAIMSDCKSPMLLKAVVSSRGPAGGWEGDTRSAPLNPRHVYLDFCPVLRQKSSEIQQSLISG
jgi:hypothetical protein